MFLHAWSRITAEPEEMPKLKAFASGDKEVISTQKHEKQTSNSAGSGAKNNLRDSRDQSGLTSPRNGSCTRKQSLEDSPSIWGDFWMNNKNADIRSILCKNEEDLRQAMEYLEADNTRITGSLPMELGIELGGELSFKVTCENRPNMAASPKKQNLPLTQRVFTKRYTELCFGLENSSGHSHDGKQYKISYEVRSLNTVGSQIDIRSDKLNFKWPVKPGKKGMTQSELSSQGQHFTIESVTASGDVYLGGQEHIDHSRNCVDTEPSLRKETLSKVELSSHCAHHLKKVLSEVEHKLDERSIRVEILGPDGGSFDIEQNNMTFPPDSVTESQNVEISLGNNTESIPPATVGASLIFGKSTKVLKPITVKLVSCLVPKPGNTFMANIFARSGKGEWKPIEQASFEHGKLLQYTSNHFCSHIAVISEEDEKNALYHLFCGFWVHKTSGLIVCLIFKFESELRKANEVLEKDHKRIFSLPGEILIGIGSTIKMEIECENHPNLQVINDDGSGGKIQISQSLRDTKVLGHVFRLSPSLEATQGVESYRFTCHAKVYDHEDNLTDGGFQTAVHFTWPQLA